MHTLPPAVAVLVQFRSLLAQMQSAYEKDERLKDFSGMESLLLLSLTKPMRMGEVAELLFCMPSNVTAIVDSLEKAGYVIRERCPEDRRATQVRLTESGENTRKHIVKMMPLAISDISGLSKQDFEDILSILNRSMD